MTDWYGDDTRVCFYTLIVCSLCVRGNEAKCHMPLICPELVLLMRPGPPGMDIVSYYSSLSLSLSLSDVLMICAPSVAQSYTTM